MGLRVGMVSHWYDPEGGGAAGPGTIARALRDRGHEVHVLTGFPIYPEGRVFPGYHLRPYSREVLEGVTVHRVPAYPSHNARAGSRAANYLSFALAGAVVGPLTMPHVDVCFVYSTPATAAIPGLALSALRRLPLVVQIQDLWPQTVTSSAAVVGSAVGRLESALNRFCDYVYRRADAIAVTSPGMADLIATRGVSRDKVSFLPNWADEKSFMPRAATAGLTAEFGSLRTFTVMYAGNFGEFQALDGVIEAAAILRTRQDIGFVLVGGGVQERRLREKVAELGLDNVRFVDPQPFSRMSDVLAVGDVQLISLRDVPLFRTTLPSKLQANLAAGKPVIGAVDGDAARIIEESGSGLVTKPGSASELARAVLALRDMPAERLAAMGARGRAYYEANFSERVLGDRLSDLLCSATRRAL